LALPTGVGYGCAFSPDGTYLAVAHQTAPYITIYTTLSYDRTTQFKVPKLEYYEAHQGVKTYLKAKP
jgi:uncharacterized protein with WD repeat